jgi:hypothetical protein
VSPVSLSGLDDRVIMLSILRFSQQERPCDSSKGIIKLNIVRRYDPLSIYLVSKRMCI